MVITNEPRLELLSGSKMLFYLSRPIHALIHWILGAGSGQLTYPHAFIEARCLLRAFKPSQLTSAFTKVDHAMHDLRLRPSLC